MRHGRELFVRQGTGLITIRKTRTSLPALRVKIEEFSHRDRNLLDGGCGDPFHRGAESLGPARLIGDLFATFGQHRVIEFANRGVLVSRLRRHVVNAVQEVRRRR